MNNRDIQAAWKYHDGTKHSHWSIRNNPHLLDWASRPHPFKIYPKIEPFPLPRDVPQTGVAALSAISEPVPSSRADSVPDLHDLARILYFSAGITKQRAHPGGEIYFRAAACTGALYEIELYVVTGDLAGLDAGVYHFNPGDVSLRLLRKGDFCRNLAQATAMEPAVAHAPATIICTGTYWRNAWSTRRAPIAISVGTTARCWRICWPFLQLRGCRPRSCSGSWTARGTVYLISIRGARVPCA